MNEKTLATLWLYTRTNSEERAKLVADRISKLLPSPIEIQSIETYPKINGHKIRASLVGDGMTWPEIVSDTIQKAQAIGGGWSLTGDIRVEIDMISNEAKASGVEMIHIQKSRT